MTFAESLALAVVRAGLEDLNERHAAAYYSGRDDEAARLRDLALSLCRWRDEAFAALRGGR